MSTGSLSLARGMTIGGWEVQEPAGADPWPEARAVRGDGVQARLTVLPVAAAPDDATLARWREALAPPWLDARARPAFPALFGLGFDAAVGAVWIARAWSAAPTVMATVRGELALSPAERGVVATAVGEAVAALHRGGAVHGALFPTRVLVERGARTTAVVLDLGLVTVARDVGLTAATLSARPDGAAPTAAADVRAYAMIVYALFAGVAPSGSDLVQGLTRWAALGDDRDPPSIDDALAALRPLLPSDAPDAGGRRDRDPPMVPPIVSGGPAVARDVWPGLVRARRPAADVRVDRADGALLTGPLRWHLREGQTEAAAAAIADAIADALDTIGGTRGWLGGGMTDALAQAGFVQVTTWPGGGRGWGRDDVRPRRERWWYRPGVRAIVRARSLALQAEAERWITSHELGTAGTTVVEVNTGALARRVDRARLLEAMLAVIERIDDRPSVTYVCRFCRQSFGDLRFHASLGACHGCSEQHLHVVH